MSCRHSLGILDIELLPTIYCKKMYSNPPLVFYFVYDISHYLEDCNFMESRSTSLTFIILGLLDMVFWLKVMETKLNLVQIKKQFVG